MLSDDDQKAVIDGFIESLVDDHDVVQDGSCVLVTVDDGGDRHVLELDISYVRIIEADEDEL